MTETPIKEKSCGIVAYYGSNQEPTYLLLHYPSGHWDFPKGHVEADETEIETASREMEEETGISHFEIIDGFRDSIEYSFRQDRKLISKTVIFFCAHTTKQEVQISHEHQDHVWLPFEDALKKLTFDNAKDILTKVHNFLQSRQ